MDERRERHPVHDLYPVILVRLTLGAGSFLALQRRPHSFPQDKEIGDPLHVVGVVDQNHASWEHLTKLSNQLRLKWALYPTHVPASVKNRLLDFSTTRILFLLS